MKNDLETNMKRNGAVMIGAATSGGRHTEASQPIRIMGFVDGDAIPPACYDEPYCLCLSPSKDDSKAYDVLREIMRRTRKVGLAAVVIEKKQALAAVIPIGRTLVLNVLRFASGMVPFKSDISTSDQPATRAVSATARTKIVSLPVTKAVNAPQRASTPLVSAEKSVRRIEAAAGDVVDLAVRRSSKHVSAPRVTKVTRIRSPAVATLHQLNLKSRAGTSETERQLA